MKFVGTPKWTKLEDETCPSCGADLALCEGHLDVGESDIDARATWVMCPCCAYTTPAMVVIGKATDAPEQNVPSPSEVA